MSTWEERATAIAKREPEPIKGRIMTPGDAYLGKFAAHEAPPQAYRAACPLFGDCDWRQFWDTPEEVRDAEDEHAEQEHGGGDPVARRQRQVFDARLERMASMPMDLIVDLAARLKSEGRMR
jgi:hypothetical protein